LLGSASMPGRSMVAKMWLGDPRETRIAISRCLAAARDRGAPQNMETWGTPGEQVEETAW
ncbi:MAG TPA: hypothetical protein VKH45_09575, partial [Candidatus Acidoferrum sp.]|nr:hypothetical protein [Candidatus Acidoferrum sp.]